MIKAECNACMSPQIPEIPFLWKGESGAVWLALNTFGDRHVCVVPGKDWSIGDQCNQALEGARMRALPPGATVTLSNTEK